MNSMSGATGFRPPKAPKGYNVIENYSPQQMDLYANQYQHLGPESFLSRLAGGDESFFDQLEAPAFRQFAELQGNLASRFSGLGMGGRKSSGFQNYMTAQGSNFAENLSARRLELRQQAIQELLSGTNTLLNQKPYSITEKQKPWWQQLLLGIGQTGAKAGVESLFGNNSSYTPGGGGF